MRLIERRRVVGGLLSATPGPPDPTYRAIAVCGGSKCVVNRGSAAQVTVARCDGSAAQKWIVAADGTVRGVQANPVPVCLDRTNASTAPGTVVRSVLCLPNVAARQRTMPTG